MKDLLDDTVADLGAMVDDEIVLYEQDCKDLSDNFEEFINVSDNRTERLTEINKGFISNIKKLLDKSNEKKLQMEIEKLQEKMLEDVETAKNEMHHLKKESELLVAKIKNEHKHSMDDLKSMIENKTKELKRIAEKLEEETLRFQQRESDFHQKFRELEKDLQDKMNRIDELQLEINALTSKSIAGAKKNEEEISHLKRQLHTFKKEKEELLIEIKDLKQQFKAAKEGMSKDLDNKILLLTKQLNVSKTEKEAIEQTLSTTKEDLDKVKNILSSKENEIEKLEIENTDLNTKLNDDAKKNALLVQELNEGKKKIETIEKELDEERNVNESINKILEENELNGSKSESMALKSKEEIQSLKQKLIDLSNENSNLELKIKELQTINSELLQEAEENRKVKIIKEGSINLNHENKSNTKENEGAKIINIVEKFDKASNTYIVGDEKEKNEIVAISKSVQTNIVATKETLLNSDGINQRHHTKAQTLQMAKEMNILLTYIRTHRMRLLDMWNKFDVDGDGFVTKEEFLQGMKNICTEVNLDISNELLTLVFEQGDVDVSTFLSFSFLIISPDMMN